MYTNVQALGNNHPTPAARLARVVGIHGDDLSTSVLDFVLKHLPERAQRRVVCGEGETAVVEHEREIQVFDGDQAVLAGQVGRGLVPEVTPLVGDAFLQDGDPARRLAPTGAELLAAGHAPLSDAQISKRRAQPTRVINERTVRKGKQAVQSHVHANDGPCVDNGSRLGQVQLQTDVPLAARAALDDNLTDVCAVRHSAVQPHADVPDVLHVQPVARQLAAVAVAVLHALETVAPLETRRSALALVEGSVRLVHTAKHLLNRSRVQHAHLVRQRVALVADAPPLCVVGHPAPAAPPVPTPFVEGVVVDGLHLVKQRRQQMRLLLGWAEAVLVGANHLLAALLLVDVPLDRLRGYVPCRADVVTTRPQVRQAALEIREFLAQFMRGVALDAVHDLVGGNCGRERAEQVNVVGLNREVQHFSAEFGCFRVNQLIQPRCHRAYQDRAAVLRYPNEVEVDVVGRVAGSLAIHERIVSCLFRSCKLTGRQEIGAIPLPR